MRAEQSRAAAVLILSGALFGSVPGCGTAPEPMILSAQHNGVVFASTTTGCIPALAECPLSATAFPVAESGDEPVQVPLQVIRTGIARWVADPIEGPVFSLDNFMRGQTRALRETGFSDGLIRGVYGLHTPGLLAPPAWLP